MARLRAFILLGVLTLAPLASFLPMVGATHSTTASDFVVSHDSLPDGLSGHVAFVDPRKTEACPSGCFYITGGRTSSNANLDLLLYAPGTAQPVVRQSGILTSARNDAAAAWLGDTGYVFGGNSGESYHTTALATSSWSMGLTPEAGSLAYEGMAAVPFGDSIYLFGGCNYIQNVPCTNQALRFTPGASPAFRVLDMPDLPARGFWAGAANATHIFLVGGEGSTLDTSRAVLAVDPAAGTFSEVASLPSATLSATAFWAAERLYVVGGYRNDNPNEDYGRTNAIIRIRPSTSTSASEVIVLGNLPESRSGHASAAFEGRALVFGGRTDCFQCETGPPPALTTIVEIAPDLPPTVAIGVTPATPDGDDGTYRTAPTIAVSASDDRPSAPAITILRNGVPVDGTSFTLTDGSWDILATATDSSGNTSTASRLLRVDTTAPGLAASLSPTSPDGLAGWYVTIPLVTFTSADPSASLSWRNDGGMTFTTGATYTFGQGTTTLIGRAKDAAGNVRLLTVGPIKVDTIRPTVAATPTPASPDGLGGWYVSRPTASISTTSTDIPDDGIAYSTNGGEPFTTGRHFSFPEGVTTLVSRARDPAGNTGLASLGPIRVDTVAPSVTVSGSEGALAGPSASILFTFSEAMERPSTEAALTGASGWALSWNEGSTALTLSRADVPDGTHTLALGAGAMDAHGNKLASAISRSVTRSSAPATASPTAPDAPVALVAIPDGLLAQLGWSPPENDHGAPVTSYHVYVDGSRVATTSSTRFVAGPFVRGSVHSFRVTALNSAGESAASQTSLGFAPISTLGTADPLPNGWHAGAPTIAITADPADATIFVDVGAGEVPYAGPFTLSDGETTLRWRAATSADSEETRERTFRVDATPPVIEGASASGAAGIATISARVSDAGSGVADVAALLSPARGAPLRVPLARGDDGAFHGSAFAPPGSYTAAILATDAAGHEASANAGVVAVAPETPLDPTSTDPSEGSSSVILIEQTSNADGSATGTSANTTPASTADAGAPNAPAAPPEPTIEIQQPEDVDVSVDAGARGVVTVRVTGIDDPASVFIVLVTEGGEETVLSEGANETSWDTTQSDDGYYTIEARRRASPAAPGEFSIQSSHANGVTLASLRVLVRNPADAIGVVAGAAVAGVMAAAAAQAGMAAMTSGASSATTAAGGGFDPLGFAQEVAIDAGQDKLRDKTKEKAALDRRRRIWSSAAAIVSLAILASLWAFSEMQAWTLQDWLAALPVVGAAAAIVTLLKFSAESALAHVTHARPRIRLWVAGMVSLAVSSIFFRNPFGYPGYVDETGESEARSTWRMQGQRGVAAIAGAAAFMLPFLALATVAPWGFVAVGILIAVTNAATTAMPFGPLPGRDVWRWNKPLAVALALAGLALYVVFATALAPVWVLWAISLTGATVYTVTIVRFRRAFGNAQQPQPSPMAVRVPVQTPVPVRDADAEEHAAPEAAPKRARKKAK